MKEPGQIVLFRFPRADLSEGKLRPALLLSEVPGPYEDWLICMIFSQVHQRIDGFDELIEEGDEDFARSGLKVTRVIRIGRLAVVEGGMLEGRMGTIKPERMTRIREAVSGRVLRRGRRAPGDRVGYHCGDSALSEAPHVTRRCAYRGNGAQPRLAAGNTQRRGRCVDRGVRSRRSACQRVVKGCITSHCN